MKEMKTRSYSLGRFRLVVVMPVFRDWDVLGYYASSSTGN
jgi:hypothetical protein